jgi:ADP-dependent NAD(P)H-hydrate dehydratase
MTQRVTDLPHPPPRPADAHKGSFGRALLICGSRGMSGAAALAGVGALRGGAGLVYLAVPAGIAATVAAVEPSYLTIRLPQDKHGMVTIEARHELARVVPSQTAVAIGLGWGQSDDILALTKWLYESVPQTLVVDADGLNALAALGIDTVRPVGPRILTPHPGEFARLTGLSTADIQQRREESAVAFAAEHDLILVLKGNGTVVTDGERVYVNETGNSGMATGGSGDVLTGLMTALLAQGMPPFEATQLAVHLHGLAGDLAAKETSERGLIASDIPRFLGRAWLEFESRS